MKTTEKIYLATLELAAESGLGNVSLSKIAEKVGIQKATLYSHFESKGALILALHEYVRERSKQSNGFAEVDYNEFIKDKTPQQIFREIIKSYAKLNSDSQTSTFYKFILSESVFSKDAAMVLIEETKKMENATKMLFYVIQEANLLKFEDVSASATLFCMAVHSLLDLNENMKLNGLENDDKIYQFIDEFCRIYQVRL